MRRFLALVISVVAVFAMCTAASAHDVPREDTLGSIEMTVRYDGAPVPGGKITCIRVGDVFEEDGNYSFRCVLDGSALEDIQSPELAQALSEFAKDKGLSGTTLSIGSRGENTGKVIFENLEIGLYLLVQDTAAPGYSALKPFLVSVPYLLDGKYAYQVNAQIKAELERTPETVPPASTTPGGPKLPQTGQLSWPVPVLAVLGMGLFSAGWMLRYGKKNDYEE